MRQVYTVRQVLLSRGQSELALDLGGPSAASTTRNEGVEDGRLRCIRVVPLLL